MNGDYITIASVALLLLGQSGAAVEFAPMTKSTESAGYEEMEEDRGVKVYKNKISQDIWLTAEGHFDTPPINVFVAILDYPRQVGVMKRIAKSQILDCGTGWMIVYQRLNLPMISDRDYVIRITYGDDDGTYWVKYKAIEHVGPPVQPGVERVTRNEGSWQVKAGSSGRGALVHYEMMIDLGGWVPKWMVRHGADGEMQRVFMDMQAMVKIQSKERNQCLSKL